jgi:hypothetical protein
LDGHYSEAVTGKGNKNSPIFSNINYNHILLIDDAKFFIGKGDYRTIEDLTEYIKSKDERYQV